MTEGLRILIVEDNALIAMGLTDLLIGLGHDVCGVARSEVEAVAAAERYRPNLMIVDSHLDEGDGIGAMRQILAKGFVPHLYVTGDPSQVQGLTQDAVVVVKPFNMKGLVEGIARAQRVAGDHDAGTHG